MPDDLKLHTGPEMRPKRIKRKRGKREGVRKRERETGKEKEMCMCGRPRQGQKSCKLRSTERNKRQAVWEKEPDRSRGRKDNPRTLFLPIETDCQNVHTYVQPG